MALIAMCVYSTETNKKDYCLRRTLQSLQNTVDFSKHSLMLSVNAHTEETKEIIQAYSNIISKVYWNKENLGTAEGINLVFKERNKGQHSVKMDDDIETRYVGWLDELEEAIERDPLIGIVGLKRKDLIESPDRNDFYKSELKMLPHAPGQSWIIVEVVNHVMGSCQLYNSALLEKIGYLWQIEGNLYGFDDSLAAVRTQIAGFYNCFLSHIRINHIDDGATDYQKWKENNASKYLASGNGKPSIYGEVVNEFKTGKRSIYYNPFA